MGFSKHFLFALLAFFALMQISAEDFVDQFTHVPEYEYTLEHSAAEDLSFPGAFVDSFGGVNVSNVSTLEDFEDFSSEDALTTGFNQAEASKIVRYAGAAYCTRLSKNNISSWGCRACSRAGQLTNVESFYNAKRNTNGYVGYDPSENRVVVSFSGTDPMSFKNIWTNLSTLTTSYSACTNCRVHYGFYTAYSEIRNTVVAMVQRKIVNSSTTVTVTGHSLGAALAAHAIADFQHSVFGFTQGEDEEEPALIGSDNPSFQIPFEELEAAYEAGIELVGPTAEEASENFVKSLSVALNLFGAESVTATKFKLSFPMYNFGQPRLGNHAFGKWFMNLIGASGLYRVTHHRDPVPHLPPLSMGFEHAMTEVFYNKEQTRFRVCMQPETKTCSNQFIFEVGFGDHVNYINYPISDDRYNC